MTTRASESLRTPPFLHTSSSTSLPWQIEPAAQRAACTKRPAPLTRVHPADTFKDNPQKSDLATLGGAEIHLGTQLDYDWQGWSTAQSRLFA